MNIRKSVAGAALIALAVFGVAACSDDGDSDSAATTSSAAEGTSTTTSSADAADSTADAGALEVDTAQEVIVGVLSTDTAPDAYADLVDSDDPAITATLMGLAQGFSAAGYTPDKFTVTEVSADGDNAATATVEVASPHAPEPVAMPMAFVNVDGTWKLSADAITSLTSMAGGH